jgi:hypothetical protein
MSQLNRILDTDLIRLNELLTARQLEPVRAR